MFTERDCLPIQFSAVYPLWSKPSPLGRVFVEKMIDAQIAKKFPLSGAAEEGKPPCGIQFRH